MNQTNQIFVSVVSFFNNHSYTRTQEDEEQERIERAWKEERNTRACRDFLRRHPTGRITQET